MPIPQAQLDRIIDSVEKALDILEKHVKSDNCDYKMLKEQLMPGKPTPFSDSPPQKIHGEGTKDLF
jgi:hypothetical protein